MTTYTITGPNEKGDYLIGYPTPGAPGTFTAAGTARTKQGAEQERDRLNKESARAAAALEADYQNRMRGVN